MGSVSSKFRTRGDAAQHAAFRSETEDQGGVPIAASRQRVGHPWAANLDLIKCDWRDFDDSQQLERVATANVSGVSRGDGLSWRRTEGAPSERSGNGKDCSASAVSRRD
jgi:hypothetical protein